MTDHIIEFIRKKDLVFKQELGRGACGRTVLLHDDLIDENFVCKKYSPFSDVFRETLFANFIREIKILHLLNHSNIVRVFNYYLYPEQYAGYILMEYVTGTDIEDHLSSQPEDATDLFIQMIEGFYYLEANNILHRDIRPQNIMVTDKGVVKLIDFGFGKQVFNSQDFDKSITLNWWCETPLDFQQQIYDFRTEVYFVGKLFEKLMFEGGLEQFKFNNLLGRMCVSDPNHRIPSFADVRREILGEKFFDIGFTNRELKSYREFSSNLHYVVAKIEVSTKYREDVEDIQSKLEDCYKKVMLEEYVPDITMITRCFINGRYNYRKDSPMPVSVLKSFVELLRACSREKKNIILSNLQTKLDSIKRFDEKDENIPF